MTSVNNPDASATDSGSKPEGTAWKDKPYLKYYAEWTPESLDYPDRKSVV